VTAVVQPSPSDAETISRLKSAVCAVIRGKDEVVELALTAVLAGGHLLLQDVPGVGKTTLAASLARALGGTFCRIQFTADLLPGDITGVIVLKPGAGEFSFRAGPLFANVVLADEINRTTPKTQSALFEAMEEGHVTVDGKTRPLPVPFLVVATQNPYDFHGTFPLPDSQLDRFLIRLSMGYLDRESERSVIRLNDVRSHLPDPVVEPEQIVALRQAAEAVSMPEEVEDYLLDLVRASRSDVRFLRGVSTRGGQALCRACRALAMVRGRGFVIPEDVRQLAVPVLAHRILPRAGGGPGGEGGVAAIRGLLGDIPAPGR
jgi:MoxR-like ATPase